MIDGWMPLSQRVFPPTMRKAGPKHREESLPGPSPAHPARCNVRRQTAERDPAPPRRSCSLPERGETRRWNQFKSPVVFRERQQLGNKV